MSVSKRELVSDALSDLLFAGVSWACGRAVLERGNQFAFEYFFLIAVAASVRGVGAATGAVRWPTDGAALLAALLASRSWARFASCWQRF